MMETFRNYSISAYLSVKEGIRSFKEDERGLSGVVVAVLLILVAVLAIVFLWSSLSDWLEKLWEKITGAGNGIEGIK
ncbi:archaellin/type IV pilin N-terminal domain-containing protein [Paenibacillus sp. MMS20-IR301]|uniref:archaellin/type IV pilin N-terminal domain-containing protein n=1 Tax=Paenibacillus sp. MMS20-IR301 TaxID=2895946 RepID=UPI0028F0319F|nr:archaellin/type IV pilin N-terminal domain-containing protein [Paenibacillus sp. MMS20-IR301]WNS42901.1 archaellin/type IV pilin N-terminal domain-containing protein [Paenibacillus sp. MMS20-IR301]